MTTSLAKCPDVPSGIAAFGAYQRTDRLNVIPAAGASQSSPCAIEPDRRGDNPRPMAIHAIATIDDIILLELVTIATIVGGWDRGNGDRGYFGVRLDLALSRQ
jgi:hypothetical protein